MVVHVHGGRVDLRWRVSILGICAAAAVPGGCTPPAVVLLLQPQLSGWQQQERLTSEQVYWSPAGREERVLAEFPLPGASTGRPTFLLYLRLPADQTNPPVGVAAGPRVKGFFIQTRGEFKGLAAVVAGQVRVASRSSHPGADRRIVLALDCEDGTRLVGRVHARRDDWRLKEFETRDRPTDVAALVEPSPAADRR